MICIDFGIKKSFKLFFQEIDIQRSIKLYSSDENIFQGKYKQNIMMISNIRFEADYMIYSKK